MVLISLEAALGIETEIEIGVPVTMAGTEVRMLFCGRMSPCCCCLGMMCLWCVDRDRGRDSRDNDRDRGGRSFSHQPGMFYIKNTFNTIIK